MPGYPRLSLLTDYGLQDGFVAACHGVVDRTTPGLTVIDITHLVPPGDVRRGAAVLAQTAPALSPAVHVAVVDPGVGTERRPVALLAGSDALVGPDNGLLGWAAEALGGVRAAVVLDRPGGRGDRVSPTFHGRDLFAPVGARLAGGTALGGLGTSIDPATLVRLTAPWQQVTAGRVAAEVLTVDRFGNVQLAAAAEDLAAARVGPGVLVRAGRRRVPATRGVTFGSVPPGQLVVLTDSAGLVAVAARDGNAAERLGVRAGDRVTLIDQPPGAPGSRPARGGAHRGGR